MSTNLNHYAIARILGAKIVPVKRARFGNFGLLETTAEILRATTDDAPAERKFTYEDDAAIARAFEAIRDGAAIDALLTDKGLAEAFARKCRDFGVEAPAALLNRRLFNIRKNAARYKSRGITLTPASRAEREPSIVPRYAHVIEFALARLRYRYGASIDDILLDPALAEQFERLARGIAPSLTSRQVRLGALYIRKTRHFEKKDIAAAKILNVETIESAMHPAGSLADLRPDSIPPGPGILEVKEINRYLYIAHNDDLRPTVEQLKTGKAFELMANGFWSPRLQEITVQFTPSDDLEGVNAGLWARRLIHDREPVFNWPMQKLAA